MFGIFGNCKEKNNIVGVGNTVPIKARESLVLRAFLFWAIRIGVSGITRVIELMNNRLLKSIRGRFLGYRNFF
ncbi:hypothetical protein ABB08_01685 [Paenibacillus larvae]|nr:hypothetical protein BXP28_00960 [Paenibacillus larvae subsp. larvae]MBH0341039.1 hypothetical protein [Paenibacillus larvae]